MLTLSAADVAAPGSLMIELRAVEADAIRKSAVYVGRIERGLSDQGDAPGNPVADTINNLEARAREASAAASAAQAVANEVQERLEAGEFKGDKGDPGKDGSDADVTAENVEKALGYKPVSDVRVAGASVAANGVAEVPLAQTWVAGEKRFSVMAPSIAHGLYVNDGLIQIYPAETGNINNRELDRPITPPNLDKAVTAAMTDGKGPAWTAAQQAAARERMGIDKPFELIEEITLTEKVTQISRNAEPNGTPYHFKKMYVSIIIPQAEKDGFIYSFFNNILVGWASDSIRSTLPVGGIAQIYAHVADGFLDGYGVGAGNQNTASRLSRYVTPSNVPSGISAINKIKIVANTDIPINTNIQIYGVRT